MSDVALDRPSYLPAAVSDRAPTLVAGLGLILGFIAIWYLVDLRQASLFAIVGAAWWWKNAVAACAPRC